MFYPNVIRAVQLKSAEILWDKGQKDKLCQIASKARATEIAQAFGSQIKK
jgi:hypothetical protein